MLRLQCNNFWTVVHVLLNLVGDRKLAILAYQIHDAASLMTNPQVRTMPATEGAGEVMLIQEVYHGLILWLPADGCV